jgi:hypothetical protein
MIRAILALLGIMAAGAAATLEAATFPPPTRQESIAGAVKTATLSGSYTLGANEVLDRVTMVYNAGTASGRFTATPPTYTATIGAFDLTTYYAQFTVRNIRTGVRTNYKTATFTFGR